MIATDPGIQMWATFIVVAVALALYASDRVPIELVSLGVICALLVLFQVVPAPGPDGRNRLDAVRLLSGFASPALIAVASLLVIGQGLVHTGVLDRAAKIVIEAGGRPRRAMPLVLGAVLAVSAVLNNIPVVVIFIPIMQALSERLGRPASGFMMPLSFAAILGGMLTLIGSSTNLLVSDGLRELGETPFGFFDFTVPGLVMAGIGLLYVFLVAPRLLPERKSPALELAAGGAGGKHFIAQLTVGPKAKLVGTGPVGGLFPGLGDVTVRMIQRRERAFVPPFEDFSFRPGDVLVVSATRKALTRTVANDPGLVHHEAMEGEAAEGEAGRREAQALAEVMVTPASRMVGQNLEQIGFRYRFGVLVLGIQRRSRMIRSRITDIRLEPGDVLLVQAPVNAIRRLRGNPDLILMEWSAEGLPSPFHARRAIAIFTATVGCAAAGVLPIAVAGLTGAAAMIATGCLNVRQAVRALDRGVVVTIAAALALGAAMQETGGAQYLAAGLLGLLKGAAPAVVLSFFFLLVSLLANVISTKACAVLFTPIAVGVARALDVDPVAFAVAVVFAANCSFASPIGYQTNLLVMAPGHYRFTDFVRAGLPLVALVWIAFSLFAPWYYGL